MNIRPNKHTIQLPSNYYYRISIVSLSLPPLLSFSSIPRHHHRSYMTWMWRGCFADLVYWWSNLESAYRHIDLHWELHRPWRIVTLFCPHFCRENHEYTPLINMLYFRMPLVVVYFCVILFFVFLVSSWGCQYPCRAGLGYDNTMAIEYCNVPCFTHSKTTATRPLPIERALTMTTDY